MPITINGTTGISGVDGSAGTPAVIGSDADTGLVFAAGQVSASVNGVAGNVPLVSGTVQNSTSGTSIDFTGIPSWVKRVTIGFQAVSTNGTSIIQVQLGTSSGATTSGYIGAVDSSSSGGVSAQNVSTGLALTRSGGAAATTTINGTAIFMLIGSNAWVGNSTNANGNSAVMNYSACSIALAGTLDRIRITTVNGTDTFDGGSINILYE